jgi:hypothetical protein
LNADKLFTDTYGPLFEKTTIDKYKTFEDFNHFVEKTLDFENQLHNFIRFSVVKPQSPETKYSYTEFSDYFAALIYKYYKRDPTKLTELQTFFGKLMNPLLLYSTFIQGCIANQSTYSDKDAALFIMNTTAETIQSINIETALTYNSKTGNVYVFAGDSDNAIDPTLSVDSLTIFSMMYIWIKWYPLIKPGIFPQLTMSLSELSEVFSEYMKQKYPKANNYRSIFVYAMLNLPVLPGNGYSGVQMIQDVIPSKTKQSETKQSETNLAKSK